MDDPVEMKGQVFRLKRQTFNQWKQSQSKLFQSHLTDEEISQGFEVQLVRPTALDTVDETRVRRIAEITAERDGAVKDYVVIACPPGLFRGKGGTRTNSGRSAGSGQGYLNKYATKLPQDAYQRAVEICARNGGPTNHGEQVRYFILQGVAAVQGDHPTARLHYKRASKLLPGIESIRLTDTQAEQVEQCRLPGETIYKLMQRLFHVGVQYCLENKPIDG